MVFSTMIWPTAVFCLLAFTHGSLGQNCGGTLTKDSPTRSITSPNYPDRLSAGITCEWIIEAPIGQVQLQFVVFNFLTAFFGCTDSGQFVSIYDGSTTSAPSLGQYCGDENGNYAPPAVIMSSSGSLLVHFYSGDFGGLMAGQGFLATFSFPDGIDHCVSSPCANGGTCVNARSSFQCLCTPGYVGMSCQVLKSSCLLPLGMANGDIEDNQISASSDVAGYEAYKGRLNGPRAWQADMTDSNQWLQVNFNTRTIITGIQTQGLWGGYVKSYRLLYGEKEDGLTAYKEAGSNSGKVFDANSDGATVVTNDIDIPIIASILRVNPEDFISPLIRLRMELLGCEEPVGSTQPATTTPGTTTGLSTAPSTSQVITTANVSTPSQTTSDLSTPGRSTPQPAVTTPSVTTPPTLAPSSQSKTTDDTTTFLIQTTTGLTTAATPTIVITTTPLESSEAPPKSTPMTSTVEPVETTTLAPPDPTTVATTSVSVTKPALTTTIQTTTADASSTMEVNTASIATRGMMMSLMILHTHTCHMHSMRKIEY